MKKFLSYFTAQNLLFDGVPLLCFSSLLVMALIEKRYDDIADKSIIVILTGVIILNRHLIKRYIGIANSYSILNEQKDYVYARREQLIGELKRTLAQSYADQDKLKNQIKALKASNPVTPKKNVKQAASKPKNV